MVRGFDFVRQLRHSIDYWSVPHFLLGTLMALMGRVFDFPVLPWFFVTLVVAVLWEFVEMHLRIREATINVVSDIVMPLLAYGLTLWLVDSRVMQHEQLVALFSVTLITYILVSYAAWRARFAHDPDFLG